MYSAEGIVTHLRMHAHETASKAKSKCKASG